MDVNDHNLKIEIERLRNQTGMSLMEAKDVILTNRKKHSIETILKEGSLQEKVDFLLKYELEKIESKIKNKRWIL